MLTRPLLFLREIDPSAALAEIEPQRHFVQAGLRADLIEQIPLVGEVHRAGKVDKADKRGRTVGNLGGIVKLQPAAFMQRRLGAGGGMVDDAIHLTGADAGNVLIVYGIDRGKDLMDALA